MAWPLQQPTRDAMKDDAERHAFDGVAERMSAMTFQGHCFSGDYYARLLWSPFVSSKLCDLGSTVRQMGSRGDSYSHSDREFVDQVLSADFHTNILQEMHLPDAISAGVRIEAIEALRSRQEDALTQDEKYLALFIRTVINGSMTAEIWDQMEQRMGSRRATVDYMLFILFLQLTMRWMRGSGMPDPSDADIDCLLAEVKSGRRAVADYRDRLK